MALCVSIPRFTLTACLFLAFAPEAQAQIFTPNLKAQSLTLSTYSWTAGAKIAFTATWKNTTLTLGKAGGHRSGLYFSTNSTISTGDTLLRTATVSGMNSGATATWKSTVIVPNRNTSNSTKYVGLYVDDKFQVKETTEADNTYRRSISYRSGRDLYVSGFIVPTTTRAGSTIRVGASVANIGHLSSPGFYTGFFLSTNSTISHSDNYLGAFYTSSLAANRATGYKYINVRIPSVPTYGTQYFGAEADSTYRASEKVETNNTRAVARKILAPLFSTRYLEYRSLLQTATKPSYMSRSQTSAVGYASVGGSVSMRVTAPAMAGGLQICVWSFKNPWLFDAASNFSLGLLNNTALFPGWFSTLDSKGQATPSFRVPKGIALPGTLVVYTRSFLFNKAFKFAGTTNSVRTVIYK